MSDNLKFFKGNEADLPIANSSNAGSIYHCEDTGNTYLSNGDQMILFASAVGKTTSLNHGEVFGDYTTNITTGENSAVFGSAGDTTSTTYLYKIDDYTYGRRQQSSRSYSSQTSNQYVTTGGVLSSKSYCYIRVYAMDTNASVKVNYRTASSTYLNYLPSGVPLVFLSTSSTTVAGLTSTNTFLTKSGLYTYDNRTVEFSTPATGTYYLWIVYAASSITSYTPTVYCWGHLSSSGLNNQLIKDDNGNAQVLNTKNSYQIVTNRPLSNISTNQHKPTLVYYYVPRASHANTHVSGLGTIAYAANQNVRGTYNTSVLNAIEIVGNGTGPTSRANAYYLTKDGKGYFSNHIYTKGRRASASVLEAQFYTVDYMGEEYIYMDETELLNIYISSGYFFSPLDYINCSINDSENTILKYVGQNYIYDGNLEGTEYRFEGIYINGNIKIVLNIFAGSQWDEEWIEATTVTTYTYQTEPVNESNISVGTSKPDDSVGENGDLYIIPHNYTLPAIYSGTSLPTSAIGVDGDIYILYSEE